MLNTIGKDWVLTWKTVVIVIITAIIFPFPLHSPFVPSFFLSSGFSFFFFPFIFISWRLITLQYCNGFCHTLTWISHGFTCVPHPEFIWFFNKITGFQIISWASQSFQSHEELQWLRVWLLQPKDTDLNSAFVTYYLSVFVSHLTFLRLSFLICKMRISTPLITQST